jgi:hypothetical protein
MARDAEQGRENVLDEPGHWYGASHSRLPLCRAALLVQLALAVVLSALRFFIPTSIAALFSGAYTFR